MLGSSCCSHLATLHALSLPLLMLGIFADHAHHAVTANDLALIANLLYRCPNLHDDLNIPSN